MASNLNKGKHGPSAVSPFNLEHRGKEGYEADIANIAKQLKSSSSEIDSIEKNFRQLASTRIIQTHPLLHLDEDANIANLNQIEILDMFLQKATLKVDERLDKLATESKSKNAKKAQASFHLDKMIEEKRREYKIKNSQVTAGPRFLYNSFSGFGSIIEIITVAERLYMIITSQGILELWERKTEAVSEVETRTNLVLHDLIQLMNDDLVYFAMKIPSATAPAIGRKSSFMRKGSFSNQGRRSSVMDPSMNVNQSEKPEHPHEEKEKKATLTLGSNLSPSGGGGSGGRRLSFAEAYSNNIDTSLKERESGASSPTGHSKSSSAMNSNDALKSDHSKPDDEIPTVIPVTQIFIGTERGSIMIFEVMTETSTSDKSKRRLSIDLKVNRNISTSPISHAIYVKLPFPMIITNASRFAVKGTNSGAVQCYLVSFDTTNYDQVWCWNAVSGSFEYGSNIKSRSRGMSYVAPRVQSPGNPQQQSKQVVSLKYPEKLVTAMGVESHVFNFFVAFNNGELVKFYHKKNEKEAHLGLGAGNVAPPSQSPGMARRMSIRPGLGSAGGAFEASSKFSGYEMVMEKLHTFRSKLVKEEKLYGSLEDSTEDKDPTKEAAKQPIVNISSIQVFSHPRSQRKHLSLGFYDGTVRVVSLDDLNKEIYYSSVRSTSNVGPAFTNIFECPQLALVISINGAGIMNIVDVERKESICEKRILLNRISVRENVSSYFKAQASDTSNNIGAVRASLTKSVQILSKENDLICVTIGNEWALISLKELKEWAQSNPSNSKA